MPLFKGYKMKKPKQPVKTLDNRMPIKGSNTMAVKLPKKKVLTDHEFNMGDKL